MIVQLILVLWLVVIFQLWVFVVGGALALQLLLPFVVDVALLKVTPFYP